MKIDYLTLFPEMFDGVLNHSIMKRAQENNKLQINTVNFRDYAINKHNQEDDSFSDGLLEFPQYTRPREFKGLTVPDVLLSGNHANIDAWRHEQKLIRTYNKRPDLIEKYPLTNADKQILERYKIGLKKG